MISLCHRHPISMWSHYNGKTWVCIPNVSGDEIITNPLFGIDIVQRMLQGRKAIHTVLSKFRPIAVDFRGSALPIPAKSNKSHQSTVFVRVSVIRGYKDNSTDVVDRLLTSFNGESEAVQTLNQTGDIMPSKHVLSFFILARIWGV